MDIDAQLVLEQIVKVLVRGTTRSGSCFSALLPVGSPTRRVIATGCLLSKGREVERVHDLELFLDETPGLDAELDRFRDLRQEVTG